MTTVNGAYSVSDLLKVTTSSVVEYGLDKIYAVMADDLANYNRQVTELLGDLCEVTVNQARVFDANSSFSMQETDEYGIPVGQKDFGKYEVAFPVRKFIAGLGWTNEHLQMVTPAQLANEYDKLTLADRKNTVRMIKRAIYNSSNYTWTDAHYNNVALTVRRFWDNDGTTVPTNNSGSSFGTTHTHYIAAQAALTNADVDYTILLVTEHNITEGLALYVSGSQLTQLENITTTKYKALRSSLMIPSTASDATVDTLAVGDLSNYQAGIWDGKYPVYVRPWCVDGYITVLATGAESKPLAWRELPFASMRGLKLDSLVSVQPIVTQSASRFAGVGVLNRSAGAVLYVTATSWANPTIS